MAIERINASTHHLLKNGAAYVQTIGDPSFDRLCSGDNRRDRLCRRAQKGSYFGRKNGRTLEQSGQYDAAMSAYASALLRVSEGRRFVAIPDKTTAANLNPATWEKPIADFVDWQFAYKKIAPDALDLVAGLDRCMPQVTYQNFVYAVSAKKLSALDYRALWQQVFCPQQSCSASVIEKAFAQSDVICTLHGNSIYSYDVSFINVESGKRIDVPVGQDMAPSFLARPGKYSVIVKSKTMFQDKKEWISALEATSLVIPPSVTVLTAYLRTEVGRNKK